MIEGSDSTLSQEVMMPAVLKRMQLSVTKGRYIYRGSRAIGFIVTLSRQVDLVDGGATAAARPQPTGTARATMRCVKHNRRVMLSVLSAVVRPIRTLEGESPVPRSVARCFGRLRRVCGVRTDTTPRFAGLVHVVGRHSTHDSRQREARAMVAWTVVVWR